MKNFIATAALSIVATAGATAAFADGHADVTMLTCAEFTAMENIDQQAAMSAIVGDVEGVMIDDTKLSEIGVLCNGEDDKMVAELLNDEADS